MPSSAPAYILNNIACKEQIAEENDRTKDILMGDFINSPSNNSLRNIFGMTWASNQCSHVPYIGKSILHDTILYNIYDCLVKTEDDQFVDLYALSYLLSSNNHIQHTNTLLCPLVR